MKLANSLEVMKLANSLEVMNLANTTIELFVFFLFIAHTVSTVESKINWK